MSSAPATITDRRDSPAQTVMRTFRDRPVVPDDPAGPVLGRRDLRGGRLARQINRRRVRTEMKAHRPNAEQPIEGGGEHVLAGVLLHVIEAPRPVNLPVHGAIARMRASLRSGAGSEIPKFGP